MIKPIDYRLDDFNRDAFDSREYSSLKVEDLHGSELIDTLLLMRFLTKTRVAAVLQEKYGQEFVWLDSDPTPPEFKNVSERYGVFFESNGPQRMKIYVPLDQDLDDAMLQVDVPNYIFTFSYIAACNYRMILHNLDGEVLSLRLAPFRPLLLFRRLIIDCCHNGGTDIHFQSVYVDKQPVHTIAYRINRELRPSTFKVDWELTKRIIQAAVAKLSTASAADLDSRAGVTTDIADLFADSTCDLRLTAMPDEAGIYVDIAIQNTTTTTMKLPELGFSKKDVSLIREISKRRTGLTLVTGEMRSGKNTTIFALLNEIIDQPIRIVEYSNPVENRMPFIQVNYKGDLDVLKNLLRLAKKQDIDLAVLNEIPNADVAFAVRDLVNSAIGVITTTHIDRIWHAPNKLYEFFGRDYKSIVSQLNAILNHKMFRKWKGPGLQRKIFEPTDSEFDQRVYKYGVRQYYVPEDPSLIRYSLQPLTEILVMTDDIKSRMLNFDEMWRAEDLIRNEIGQSKGRIEYKLAAYVNAGICSLDEFHRI